MENILLFLGYLGLSAFFVLLFTFILILIIQNIIEIKKMLEK